eukprot:1139865-Pelagomonas_calceolata.AAC.5
MPDLCVSSAYGPARSSREGLQVRLLKRGWLFGGEVPPACQLGRLKWPSWRDRVSPWSPVALADAQAVGLRETAMGVIAGL